MSASCEFQNFQVPERRCLITGAVNNACGTESPRFPSYLSAALDMQGLPTRQPAGPPPVSGLLSLHIPVYHFPSAPNHPRASVRDCRAHPFSSPCHTEVRKFTGLGLTGALKAGAEAAGKGGIRALCRKLTLRFKIFPAVRPRCLVSSWTRDLESEGCNVNTLVLRLSYN